MVPKYVLLYLFFQIFNKPNGTDVYKGVPKDYTGKNVTADTFINILKERVFHFAGIFPGIPKCDMTLINLLKKIFYNQIE